MSIYYVDATSGNDGNDGLSTDEAWKTLSQVSGFTFGEGDQILLKKGEEWEEQLIFENSGVVGNPIIIGAYGSGNDPKIKLSTTFASDDWSLEYDASGEKVYKGEISNNKWPLGAVKNDSRINVYTVTAGSPEELTTDETFGNPYNVWYFYYRSDNGVPEEMEVGSRRYGIYITGENVTVQDIEIYGPAGNWEGTGVTGVNAPNPIKLVGCNNVTIQRCTLSHTTTGSINISTGSSNCTVTYCTGNDMETSLSFVDSGGANSGHVLSHNIATNVNRLDTDGGDGSFIGVYQTDGVQILYNNFNTNGHVGDTGLDAQISIVDSDNCIIHGNIMQNCGSSCGYTAENADGNIWSCNIFDTWGIATGSLSTGPLENGLRIGNSSATDTHTGNKVYNNLFIGGGPTGDFGALNLAWANNLNTEVKNNIFYNNTGQYEMRLASRSSFSGWDFQNNLIYRTSGNAILHDVTTYDYAHIVGNSSGYFSNDRSYEDGTLTDDPLFLDISIGDYRQKPNSPCWMAGVDVSNYVSKDISGEKMPGCGGWPMGPYAAPAQLGTDNGMVFCGF